MVAPNAHVAQRATIDNVSIFGFIGLPCFGAAGAVRVCLPLNGFNVKTMAGVDLTQEKQVWTEVPRPQSDLSKKTTCEKSRDFVRVK